MHDLRLKACHPRAGAPDRDELFSRESGCGQFPAPEGRFLAIQGGVRRGSGGGCSDRPELARSVASLRASLASEAPSRGWADRTARGCFFPGEGVVDSWTERPPMPMPSASDPSNRVGRLWTVARNGRRTPAATAPQPMVWAIAARQFPAIRASALPPRGTVAIGLARSAAPARDRLALTDGMYFAALRSRFEASVETTTDSDNDHRALTTRPLARRDRRRGCAGRRAAPRRGRRARCGRSAGHRHGARSRARGSHSARP